MKLKIYTSLKLLFPIIALAIITNLSYTHAGNNENMCNYSCKSNSTCEYSHDVGFHCVCYGASCNGSDDGPPTPCPTGTAVSYESPTYYCGRTTNVTWNRVAGCCAWSGGNQVCGDFYKCPTRNNKDKMCRDCTTEDPYCYPYNGLVEVGYCKSIIPPVPVTGYVWEDTDGNNVRSNTDKHWGLVSNGGCTTSVSATMRVRDNAAGTNAGFACGGTSKFPNPMFTTSTHAAAASLSFTLTPPNNIACSVVVWDYTVCENAACTAKHTGSGTGCTATLLNTAANSNTLNWRVGQTIPRTITGNLYEVTNTTTCASTAAVTNSGLTVKAFNGVTQKGTTANVSGSAYGIAGLLSTDTITSICVNGTLADATKSYVLSCVKGANTSGAAFTCTPGSGACAVVCTPTTTLTTGNATLSFGFTPISNDKWFSVIDGDVYADGISAYVASTPLGGFSSYLINSQTGSSVGGYGFAASTIDTQASGTDVSEKGGSAERLAVLPSYPPTDQWLNKFSFSVPNGAITSVPSGNTFEEGKVYSFTVDQFNQVINNGTYSFAGGNSNAPAASIVYVTGSGTISINKNFTSANANKTLLLVTTADVNITTTPGTTTASYTVAGASQIDLSLITQGDVTFVSGYNGATAVYDAPLMIYGSLMSAGTINLDRNLGAIDNSSYPATSIRFYPYLMSLIQRYEIQSASSGAYTGLATVDVQFSYGDQ